MTDAKFDVFLSHNSQDKPSVRELMQHLLGHENLTGEPIQVWFDEDELQPGLPWQQLLEHGIKNSLSVAVLIGKDGLGPWEDEEMQGALRLAVKDKCPVIPVLLPGAHDQPELPMLLGNRTWVDLRRGFVDAGLEKLAQETEFWFGGESQLANHAWWSKNAEGRTHSLAESVQAGGHENAWGLYDMHGNVCEWCQDWYGEYLQAAGQNNPQSCFYSSSSICTHYRVSPSDFWWLFTGWYGGGRVWRCRWLFCWYSGCFLV